MKDKYGITDQLLESGLLKRPISSAELSERLGIAVGSINSALNTLYVRSKVSREVTVNGWLWREASIHWIWGSAISRCDPDERVYRRVPPPIFGERGYRAEA
jgi:hypothetical protein